MIRPLAACLLALPVIAMAQTPAAPSDAGPAGKWEGALGNLRLVLEVTKSSDGLLIATLRSVDQGNVPIPVESARQVGDSLYLEIPVIRGRYSAKLSSDRTQLIGLFDQGTPLPLTLTRTTAIVTAAPR